MKRAFTATILIIAAVIALFFGISFFRNDSSTSSESPKAYIGVAYCGDTVAQGKLMIDKVKDYTNLFVLQSGLLQRDLESVDELGDYAISAGMYFLPYFGNYIQSSFSEWIETAKQKWGTHLLGVYYSDEPGGKMLDGYVEFNDAITGDSITKTTYGDIVVKKTNSIVINYELGGTIHLYEPPLDHSNSDINSEATFYHNGTIKIVKPAVNGFSFNSYQELINIKPFITLNETAQRFYAREKDNIDFLKNKSTEVFTSDYVLYWFDYLAGYDVVLSQVGWNLSLNQQIGLIRGAASLQNKSWGIVITWKYQQPPYLDSGSEILNQMRTAYRCGAKYFVLFDYYDETNNSTYGTMNEEHFEALKSFWSDVIKNPKVVQGSIKADSALVLPKDYGWGTRWDGDKIWGIFVADEKSHQIWDLMQNSLNEHGFNLDIVYGDPHYPLLKEYLNVYSTNQFG
jgi:hypothetical protein